LIDKICVWPFSGNRATIPSSQWRPQFLIWKLIHAVDGCIDILVWQEIYAMWNGFRIFIWWQCRTLGKGQGLVVQFTLDFHPSEPQSIIFLLPLTLKGLRSRYPNSEWAFVNSDFQNNHFLVFDLNLKKWNLTCFFPTSF